jgi:membrane-bound lytic murein transglycosylase D
MLKIKLIGTGIFISLLLIIFLTVNAAGFKNPVISTSPLFTDTAVECVAFDAANLTVSGLAEEDADKIPAIIMNQKATKFVAQYVKNNSELLSRIKEKNPGYFKIMDSVFTHFNLPLELKYLAIVESELKSRAVSRVGAVGAWQLMPSTARLLSLKVTAKYDERKHFYKSTVAAAKYLAYLHKVYKDWLLVLAAYNSGPGTVNMAIKKSGSRNFWKLQYFLPAETRGHVKRFIATHYYYEGRGGVTTLTKAELATYTKKMKNFVDTINAEILAETTNEMLAVENNVTINNEPVLTTKMNTALKATEDK